MAAFPIGIDPERFQRALERVDVRSHIAELLNRYAGRKVRHLTETSLAASACVHTDSHSVHVNNSQVMVRMGCPQTSIDA